MNAKIIGAAAVALVGVGLAAWSVAGQLGGSAKSVRSASGGWEANRDAPPEPHASAEEFIAADDPDAADRAREAGIELPVEAGAPRRLVGPNGEPMGPMPAWMSPIEAPEQGWSFRRVSDAADAAAALEDGVMALEDEVTRNDTLGALAGASRLSIIESWKRFTRPILADDPAAFASAVATLGGLASEISESDSPDGAVDGLFRRLSGFLAGAAIDWAASTTRKADAANPMDIPRRPRLPDGVRLEGSSIPMMTMVMRNEGPDGAASERRAVSIPLQAIFVNAAEAAENGAPVVEVWTPASIRGGAGGAPDAGVGTYMVWVADDRLWAPVAMRITIESDEGRSALDRVQEGG
ncbi:MAG: hypothetical protein RIB60_00225 [Phycisphaerales bacterium]